MTHSFLPNFSRLVSGGAKEKRMTAAERSIDTIIYTLMPALPENREPIGFHA